MRRLHRIAAVVATGTLAIALTACDDDAGSSTDTTQPDTTGAADTDENAELRELYADVLDRADEFEYQNPDSPSRGEATGEYQYAVADINADNRPELLVKAVTPEISKTRIFSSTDDIQLIEVDKLFGEGVGSAGGERLEFHVSADHDSVLAADGRSGTGQYRTTEWALEGDQMVETGQTWDYKIDQIPADLTDAQDDVPWAPVDDRSALDNLREVEDASEAPDDDRGGPNPDPPPSSDDSAEEPDAGDDPAADTGSRSKADFPNFGANSATSDEFARTVYNAWIDQYIATGETAPTLNVASPVTGESYAMNCTYSVNVTCSGGNNARVMIHPPAPDPASIPGGVMWG